MAHICIPNGDVAAAAVVVVAVVATVDFCVAAGDGSQRSNNNRLRVLVRFFLMMCAAYDVVGDKIGRGRRGVAGGREREKEVFPKRT